MSRAEENEPANDEKKPRRPRPRSEDRPRLPSAWPVPEEDRPSGELPFTD